MENFTAKLFGMEMRFFQRCKEAERKQYRTVAILFIALIAACVLAFNYFFYLLLQSHVLAFLLSLILGFVYYSILRFSIITIGIPLTEVITIKRVILNSGNIFRAIIFSMFVFSITVPLTAFVYRKELNPKIDEIKSGLVVEYNTFKTKSQNLQLDALDQRISEKRNEINQIKSSQTEERLKSFKIQKINQSIGILENKRVLKASELTKSTLASVNNYAAQLVDIDMPFKRFQLLFNLQGSPIIICLLFFTFFSIIPFYLLLLCGKNYEYAKIYQNEIELLVKSNDQITFENCSTFLKKNFQYKLEKSNLYEDPPFNRIPVFKGYTKIIDRNLFLHFDKKV
jgi:hypothetical protein